MGDKMKRRLDDIFSGGDWSSITEKDDAPKRAAISFGGGPGPDMLDLLREQGVSTSFFLSGTRAESPRPSPNPDLSGLYRVPPEPFFAQLGRNEPLLADHWTRPCFVRLPHGDGHRTLKVYRLLRDARVECILIRWIYSSTEGALADGGAEEQDLLQRCRQAVEGGSVGGRVAGTLLFMIDDPADVDMPFSARFAPLLLREMLAGARQPQWALVGVAAPAPVAA